MINNNKVLALIPARGGSKGLSRKNIMELCGRPLLGWPVHAALQSKYIDKVIVSTEDAEIAETARRQGAEIPFMRPAELATDTASSYMVIEHAIKFFIDQKIFFDYLVLLEPTSPLTEAADVDNALESLTAKRNIADSIVSVSKVEAAHPVFDVFISDAGLIAPYIGVDFSDAGRRQDITNLYFFDGSLYITDIKTYLSKKTFYHDRAMAHVSPKWKSLEVDDYIDFICVESIMKNIEVIKEIEKQKEIGK